MIKHFQNQGLDPISFDLVLSSIAGSEPLKIQK